MSPPGTRSEEENKLRSTLEPAAQQERPQPKQQQQQRNLRRRRQQQQQPMLDHMLPPRGSDRRPVAEKTLSRHSTRYSINTNTSEASSGKAGGGGGSANGSFRGGSRVARSLQEEKRGAVSEDDGLIGFDFAGGARGGDRTADSFSLGDMGHHAGKAAMATDEFGMQPGGRLSQRVGVVGSP